MTGWACNRCDQLHTQNPHECRNCGHGIFRPVSEEELQEASTGGDQPEAYEPELTVGSPQETEYARSPDVNPDGSVATPDSQSRNDMGLIARILSWVR